jgi:hypothetical protein
MIVDAAGTGKSGALTQPERVRVSFRAALVLVLVVGIALHVWIAGQKGPSYTTFSREFTQRLASGHLDLARQPDPRLLALPNPYDPARNEGLRLLDASLYGGHYYLYFGVTPFATLLAPYYVATGSTMGEPAAVCLYCAGGLILCALFLGGVAEAYFPRGARWAAVLGLATLAAGPTLLLVRRPSIYELEISGAFFFLSAALAGSFAALRLRTARTLWTAASSACIALAVGCRPNYALLVPFWLALVAWAFSNEEAAAPERRRWLLAALSPLVVIGSALAAYNWARFGNPLEFGFRYQLMAYDRPKVGFWSLRNLGYNGYRYVFGEWRLGHSFPFVLGQAADRIALPAHHELTEYIYGLMLTSPTVWLLAFVPRVAGLRRGVPQTLISLCVGVAVLNLGVLLGMGNGSYRYLPDFLPPLLLAGSLAGLAVMARLNRRPVVRLAAWAAFAGMAAWSCVFALCAQFSLLDIFRDYNAEAFSRVGAVFNAPVRWADAIRGREPTVPAASVRLPQAAFGRVEPLLVTGERSKQDFIYLYYTAPGLLQVGFESIGHGGPISEPFAVDYAKAHRIELHAGSFLPAEGDPLWGGIPPGEAALSRRELVVRVDGRIVLDGTAQFHDPKGLLFWGKSPFDAAFGSRFSGDFLDRHPAPALALPSPQRVQGAEYGPLLLSIDLSRLPIGQAQPLVSLGLRHQGALLSLIRTSAEEVRLVYQSEGLEMRRTPVFPADPGRRHRLRLSLPCLRPPLESALWPDGMPESAAQPLKEDACVDWDDRPALADLAGPQDVSPVSVAVGRNSVGYSGVAPDTGAGSITWRREPWNR